MLLRSIQNVFRGVIFLGLRGRLAGRLGVVDDVVVVVGHRLPEDVASAGEGTVHPVSETGGNDKKDVIRGFLQ